MAGKKNWKRIDVSSIHESLVESNIAKTARRRPISEDIVIDVVGRPPSKKIAKKLKSPKYVGTLAQRGNVERKKLIKLVKRLKVDSDRIEIDEPESPEKPAVDDIWADNGTKKGTRRSKDLNLYQVIPAVAVPHSGQSYNPDPSAYEELVNAVVEAIPKNERQSDEPLTDLIREALPSLELENLSLRRKQKLAYLIVQNKVDEKAVLEVLQEDSGDDSDAEEEEDVSLEQDTQRRSKKLKRKTKAQRNRQKIHMENMRKIMLKKKMKQLEHDIQNIKSNMKVLEEKDKAAGDSKAERLQAYLNRLIEGKAQTRFGNKVYQADPEEVALPDEITPSVRKLQTPLKSPIDNVVRSIYRRGLVPAPPVLDRNYRNFVSKKVIKRSMKYKSKLLEGTT